uniref:Amino acid transporter transmembrane domain-containing protein n=1 Tax=Rhizophora mucronata TaxID=61149 RepID=A0A2P2JEH3_RHIMU
MEDGFKNPTESPLLEPSQSSSTGRETASSIQTLGNIIVSIVGTGILGLPFAFKIAGWLAGLLGVVISGATTYYCMLLLVRCRDKLASQELTQETTYGDLGYKSLGNTGRYLTESLIFISQCGGSVAYLVFIGQNLSSIFGGYGPSFKSFIFLLVPIEIALSWSRSLSALAPFSIFANVCNVLAMVIVVKGDIVKVLSGEFKFSDRKAITSNIGGLLLAGGMALFCFEGFGMTLALEASMRETGRFPSLLAKAFAGITFVYVSFGFSGYMAYGDETKDIITLNLPHNWSAIAVQVTCHHLAPSIVFCH